MTDSIEIIAGMENSYLLKKYVNPDIFEINKYSEIRPIVEAVMDYLKGHEGADIDEVTNAYLRNKKECDINKAQELVDKYKFKGRAELQRTIKKARKSNSPYILGKYDGIEKTTTNTDTYANTDTYDLERAEWEGML